MGTKKKKSEPPVVPNLERGLLILQHLAQHAEGQGISDLTAALGYPLNSVFRITNTLLKHGYVERNLLNKKFTLTKKMFTMAYNSEPDRTLMENAIDLMRELRDKVKETVIISIMDRNEGLVLEQVQGLHPFRFMADAGTRQPAHAGSTTKAIIAYMPDREREATLQAIEYRRLTAHSITSRTAFEAELKDVRSKGYAVDRAEALDGVHCVGAPIFNRQGYPISAITVTGPSNRLPEENFPAIGVLVKDCAMKISVRLGYPGKD